MDAQKSWMCGAGRVLQVSTPVLELFPFAVCSGQERSVWLVVFAVPLLIRNASFPPPSEMVEMDDATSRSVQAWSALLSQPHMIVPVYLHALRELHASTTLAQNQ